MLVIPHVSQHFYPDRRGNGQCQTDGQIECSVFKVAAGCDAASALTGVRPRTHVGQRNRLVLRHSRPSQKDSTQSAR